jgi:hypothetical protein
LPLLTRCRTRWTFTEGHAYKLLASRTPNKKIGLIASHLAVDHGRQILGTADLSITDFYNDITLLQPSLRSWSISFNTRKRSTAIGILGANAEVGM